MWRSSKPTVNSDQRLVEVPKAETHYSSFTRLQIVESIYSNIPDDHTREHFFDLIHMENMRIERIVTHGQSSPESGWYDQDEDEWVIVLEGAGTIQFEDGREITLD